MVRLRGIDRSFRQWYFVVGLDDDSEDRVLRESGPRLNGDVGVSSENWRGEDNFHVRSNDHARGGGPSCGLAVQAGPGQSA